MPIFFKLFKFNVANYDLLAAFPLILFNSFKSVQVSHVEMVVFAMQLEENLTAHV